MRRFRHVLAAAVTAASGLAVTAQVAQAASVICLNSSLISSITTANTSTRGATVTLPRGCTYTLTAANNATDGGTGLPVITGKVTITGNGATIARSAAAGTPAFRIFDVASSGSLTLNAVVLANGLANDGQSGGGAVNSHGTLAVSGSTFTGNQSPAATGVSGGAIASSAKLTIATSTFSDNLAQEGGGVFTEGTASITTTTFSNNTATIFGGGGIVSAAGTTTVSASTFIGNSGPGGGAIDNDATLIVSDSTLRQYRWEQRRWRDPELRQRHGHQLDTVEQQSQYGADLHNYGTSTLSVRSSIVANGVSGSNCSGAPIVDAGYNMDTGSSCGFSSAGPSMSNTQPQLEALASNGGSTQTMALPAASAAVNAIPATVTGCMGSTDQRGVVRPQGPGCDIGAYEVVSSGGGITPPTTPTGLHATSVTASAVTLSWNQSTERFGSGVTGYTVYRNGSAIGSTGGPAATSFTDTTVAPATVYSYAVDAFDGGGRHSARSATITVTTSAPSGIHYVQAGAFATATAVTQTTVALTGAVSAGDLLVGWFAQYNSGGPVQVSDNVNGASTRSTSTTFSNGGGDIALYYVQNAAASPYGVTVTVSSAAPTYLEGVAGEYSGVASAGALDQAAVSSGIGTAVDTGPTAGVAAGELVVGAILTGGSPGTVSPGQSQGQALTMRAQTGSGSADIDDILAFTAGAQDALATLGSPTDWYAVTAVFHAFG